MPYGDAGIYNVSRFYHLIELAIIKLYAPTCKNVVIGKKSFGNLERKKNITRQKKTFSFSDFLLSFNMFLSHRITNVLLSYDNVLASKWIIIYT